MKRASINIAIIFFTMIFTTTSGGLFFIFHHCRAHNHSVVTFFNEVKGDCCHHTASHCSSGGAQDCCQDPGAVCDSDHKQSDPCCSERAVYLKVPYQFLQSHNKIIPSIHELVLCTVMPLLLDEPDIPEAVLIPRIGLAWRASPPDILVMFAQIRI